MSTAYLPGKFVAALLLTFGVGLACGYGVRMFTTSSFPYSYRTRVPLFVGDAKGRAVGRLPEQALIVSKYPLMKAEIGWWGCVPVYLGDATDAIELLHAGGRTPSLIPATDMLVAGRNPIRPITSPTFDVPPNLR